MSLLNFLKIPETQIITDLDSCERTILHRQIIKNKPFLYKLYRDFYNTFQHIIKSMPNGRFLEIGSGSGIIKEFFPNIMTSDILQIQGVDITCSALALPFQNNSLDGIFMLNTLHHIPDAGKFFSESQRCLKPEAQIILIEHANTFFSRFIYQNFHHENFDPFAQTWTFETSGPMSGANGALPWIVFSRDRQKFQQNFPELQLLSYKNHTPLRYLLSGGLTLRQLVPSCFYPIIKGMEWLLSPLNSFLGLFTTIVLKKL